MAPPPPGSPESRDIVDLVGRYTSLVPAGPGAWRGTCPVCGSSAFRVRLFYGTFHCFGCGVAGDGDAFLAAVGLCS
ncbi:CHC2 zinc finger domain-containing protein [Kibdelosporangium phytohabitans]|uniref:CHC2 zinc finger domain-containing protein n=1 Tax=Kibdelosporangium phytohabitans TaxID=860235 RepID=UPI0009FAA26C